MGSIFTRFRKFLSTASYSQKVGLVALLIVSAALPLTIIVSQQQQNTKQEAAPSAGRESCGKVYTTLKICNSNCPSSSTISTRCKQVRDTSRFMTGILYAYQC
ncbi:hypothetical protein KKG52_02155, partial [Patescibacteria group bacterium]|nr:hypothetical protein [Patescibacteria group bacterium]